MDKARALCKWEYRNLRKELETAIWQNNVRRFTLALRKVPDLNHKYLNDRGRPLYEALMSKNPVFAEMLLQNGADPNHERVLDDHLLDFWFDPGVRQRAVDMLLRYGAHIPSRNPFMQDCVENYVRHTMALAEMPVLLRSRVHAVLCCLARTRWVRLEGFLKLYVFRVVAAGHFVRKWKVFTQEQVRVRGVLGFPEVME